MSLLTNKEESFIKIPLYYSFEDTEFNFKKVKILQEEEAKTILGNEETKDHVKILNTTWKQLNWKEQNDLYSKASKANMATGQVEIDYAKYRDLKIKYCLIDWDYMEKGQKIKLTPDVIDVMNADVVMALFDKYESVTTVETSDRGN